MVAEAVNPHVPLRERLVELLADGEFHSGEYLAQLLGVSRTAIWKALNGLEELGIELHRVPKRGYRWVLGPSLLNASRIGQCLSDSTRAQLRNLHLHFHIDSTNSQLLKMQDLPARQSDVCLAEYQSAGRGRRGRQWVAPFGGGLCLSVSRTFAETPRQLGALSLAAGVAVLRALARLNLPGAGLKWPNDLLFNGRKLGGILIELRAEAAGPVYTVIGVGLNVRLSADVREDIRLGSDGEALEAAALNEIAGATAVDRNLLAAAIIDELIAMLDKFQHSGFRSFAPAWIEADALAATPVRVLAGEEVFKGLARGIDEEGALLLETPGRLLRFTSGEVSLRTGSLK
jgi:BirA family biotin operon repressor/biotin-[acetyl-CoA-carboxylase] ligase